MMIHHRIPVLRSWEPGTVAIVTCLVRGERLSAVELRKRIQAGVHKWIANTESGRIAWTDSHENFNVGDLVEYQSNPQLIAFLDDFGVRQLEVKTTAHDSSGWEYDDVLGEAPDL